MHAQCGWQKSVTVLRVSPIAALRQPRPSPFLPLLFLFANMAENAIDSDLYGGTPVSVPSIRAAPSCAFSDIYGDDEENEYEVATQDPSPEAEDAEDVKPELSTPSSSTAKPDDPPLAHHTLPPDAHRGLPPKPAVAPPSSLSYSAQVAKQFSVYQQTPSQERQQRREIPLPPNPRANASAPRPAAAAAEARPAAPANPGDTVFGKKPSEMHDSG